jgi:hypothetical protein
MLNERNNQFLSFNVTAGTGRPCVARFAPLIRTRRVQAEETFSFIAKRQYFLSQQSIDRATEVTRIAEEDMLAPLSLKICQNFTS